MALISSRRSHLRGISKRRRSRAGSAGAAVVVVLASFLVVVVVVVVVAAAPSPPPPPSATTTTCAFAGSSTFGAAGRSRHSSFRGPALVVLSSARRASPFPVPPSLFVTVVGLRRPYSISVAATAASTPSSSVSSSVPSSSSDGKIREGGGAVPGEEQRGGTASSRIENDDDNDPPEAPAAFASSSSSSSSRGSLLSRDDDAGQGRHEQQQRQQRQLWLDLRGTALFPSEAVAFLEKILRDEEEDEDEEEGDVATVTLIDRILLDEGLFFKFASSGSKYDRWQERLSCSADGGFDLLYTTNSGDLFVSSASASRPQRPCQVGRIMANRAEGSSGATLLDPLQALETTGRGGWIVIDPASDGDEDAQRESSSSRTATLEDQLCGLIEFLAGASAAATRTLTGPPSQLSPSGLLIPASEETAADDSLSSGSSNVAVGLEGGVAVTCRSTSSLLRVDAALKRSAGSSSSATESGILLLPSPGCGGCGGRSVPIRTALVLPLDGRMWKMAAELKRLDEDGGDGYRDEDDDR